jgi:hypothetical protein
LTSGGLRNPALGCLARAGWTPQRHVDVAPYVRQLEEDGYTVPDAVRAFLSRYGGLRLTFPHFRVPTDEDSCHFDAAAAARRVFPTTVAKWSGGVGEALCPVGEAYGDHMTLTMTRSGAVYAGLDGTLIQLGDSPEQAINHLCEGRDDERRVPLPGFFDERASAAVGPPLDALLAQADGPHGGYVPPRPTRPARPADPSIPADLHALLHRRNGFTAFHGGLQVYRLGDPGIGPELHAWNEPRAWKQAYGPRADGLLCFARSLLGEQYAFDLVHGGIVLFDPDTGDREGGLGSTVEEWAAWLFEYPFLHSKAVDNWARAYQDAHGPLAPDQCLAPVVPFAEGGPYDVENFTAVAMAESLRARAAAL